MEAHDIGTGRPWATLSPRQRAQRVLAAALVVTLVLLHGAALAHRLLPAEVRAGLPAPARALGPRLDRVARWDMFRTIRQDHPLVVEGRAATGAWFDLANPFVRGLDPWRRLVDRRLRAFHDRLRGGRRLQIWGRPYLAYLCRVGPHDLRETRVVQLEDAGRRTVVLRYRCGDPVRPFGPHLRSVVGE